MGGPSTLDPAATGDAGSAAVIAQLFETLTAFDDERRLQPALAESWRIDDDGRRIVFQLRPDLTFSDGTPLRASDVVRSWLRLIDPAAPSPLVTLMFDVVGAREYLPAGRSRTSACVADDDAGTVTVDLVRPAADFPTIVASPTFAIVPPGDRRRPRGLAPGEDFVASGGYRLAEVTDDDDAVSRRTSATGRGPPALTSIEAVDRSRRREPGRGVRGRRARLRADRRLRCRLDRLRRGRSARSSARSPSLSTDYYGFDTTAAPFDDVRVRQAFGAAVDWRRIAHLAAGRPGGLSPPRWSRRASPAGRERDFVPATTRTRPGPCWPRPASRAARASRHVTLMTGGGYDDAVIAELETRARASTSRPRRWTSTPTSSGSTRTRRRSGPCRGSPTTRAATTSWASCWAPARQQLRRLELGGVRRGDRRRRIGRGRGRPPRAAYDRAEDVVQRDVPVVPMSYGTGWALSRDGLLGAGQNGLGILRMAGLAWAD